MEQRPYGALNIVAQPHPVGVYRRIFDAAALLTSGARFHGDNFARISRLADDDRGFLKGRLAIWTEIDPREPVINKATLDQSILSDSDLSFQSEIGFNSRVFNFIFREQKHEVVVELRNDLGSSISIGRAKLAFQKIFQYVKVEGVDDISVHAKSAHDAVDRVLDLDTLRKIRIHLQIPNPDDLSEATAAIMAEIDQLNTKVIDTELTKRAGPDGLKLNDRYKAMAEIAKDNGFVSSEGMNEVGEKETRSTKDTPDVFSQQFLENETSYSALRRAAEARDGRQ